MTDPTLAEDPEEVDKRVAAAVKPASRFQVSMEIEMGFDGQDSDDSDWDFDVQGTLAEAFSKAKAEILGATPHQIQVDYGMEWDSVTLTVWDNETRKGETTRLQWNGSWIER